MPRPTHFLVSGALAIAALIGAPSCTDSTSADYVEPVGEPPQIVRVDGPTDVLTCIIKDTGGACPLTPLSVTFRLAEDQFVRMAYVRFQGDTSDNGADRGYLLTPTYGGGAADVTVNVANAVVPANILGTTTFFTFWVRLVTGAGEESTESRFDISVVTVKPGSGD